MPQNDADIPLTSESVRGVIGKHWTRHQIIIAQEYSIISQTKASCIALGEKPM
jgi:hypothetical protein